jgi:hypothetical protein
MNSCASTGTARGSALLIKGDEKPGALAEIYQILSRAGIQVNEASGIADINAG